jgi:hypothetical protein
MTETGRKKDAREIVRQFKKIEELEMTERGAALLHVLATNGNPATRKADYVQFAATLGPLFNDSSLISYHSRESLAKELRWGRTAPGKKPRTPEEVRNARKKAVQRAEKELLDLGVLAVFPKAGPVPFVRPVNGGQKVPRPDLRTNLYVVRIDVCLSLLEESTRGHERPLVEYEPEANEGSLTTPRFTERGVTESQNEGSPVTPKEQLFLKDQKLSQDQLAASLETSEPTEEKEREILSALIANGYSRKADEETIEAARELVSLYATPEAIERAESTWAEMGRTYVLGLKGLVRNWEAIAGSMYEPEINLPAPIWEKVVRQDFQCYCGGSLHLTPVQEWEEGESTIYLCPRIHNFKEHKKPSPEWLWNKGLLSLDDTDWGPFKAISEHIVESAKDKSPKNARCTCGEKLWVRSDWGKVLCFRFHDDEGRPDEVKWKVYGLGDYEEQRRKHKRAEIARQEAEGKTREEMTFSDFIWPRSPQEEEKNKQDQGTKAAV